MCFDPKKDGNAIWPAIHIFAANAQNQAMIAAFVNFVNSLPTMYPCAKCRAHTSKFLQEKPIEQYIESAQQLLYWTYLYHDSVNRKLNKPMDNRWTWEQVRDHYMAPCEELRPHATNFRQKVDCGECSLEEDETPAPVDQKIVEKKNLHQRVYLDR